MRRKTHLKHIGFGFIALGLSAAFPALAQTQVSASVNMSGSCASCDLSNRVMPRLSLQGSNFSGSNFSRSNLSGAKFHKSNLTGASFHKAYLMRVEGGYTNMHNSNLRDATLIEARLTNSDISNADLRRADLTKGVFSNSNFVFSDLTSSDAVGADFRSANFANATLNHGDFSDVDFTKSNFIKTKFGDAILTNANFMGANLSGANLLNVQGLTQVQLDSACGDDKTILPNGLALKQCTAIAAEPVTVMAELNFAPPAPTYPAQPRQVVDKAMAIDLALVEIEATLRDLPLSSPLHKRLSKSRTLLEQAKAHPPLK